MTLDRNILDEAAAWAVRTSEPGFEDWPGFTDWLERAPEHAAAYDHVMLAVEDGAAMLEADPANDIDEAGPVLWRRWFAPAFAACLALVAAVWVWQANDAASVYRTVPGETRQIALGDGSVIVMAGDTELIVDPDRDRYARLERGRALFEIRHDDLNPFRVDVGRATLVDAGTVFDVSIRRSEVGVGVSEGAVIYNPAKQNARIEPGQILTFDKASAAYDLADIPLDQVGEWREGRLTFLGSPLSDVAADIAQASGIDYRASETSGERPISGSIAIEPLRADPASLGPLLGVTVERRGETWILASR
ncbi:FecR family protein [Qipengyuania qiaonensis]|uniref:FecR domain-containing protein n=1 Tax=Qipengyuania qiaonensis TaxID=2867240 RepID=A0ABS7J3N8_9SPHN|nr:FecR domain-containing protein [Qipengyuania qiaonensis]MBX7481944.1 FecR domain-containing protein [Qipengyuania qiaonensis]